MPIMTNPETGESKEISMEEFMEAMRGGKISVRQEVRHADGSVSSSMVFGNDIGDGVDRSINVFGTLQAVLKPVLLKAQKIKEADPDAENLFFMDNSGADYEITIDDTEKPMMHIITCKNDTVRVARYLRDERKTVGKPASENTFTFVSGELSGTVDEIQADVLLLISFAAFEIRRLLDERGQLQELKKLDNRSSGVIIKTDGDEIITKIVRGRNRPDLPCLMFGGLFAQGIEDAVMMRPYMDELMSETLRAGMSIEDMITEAEDGDPDCMESLAQAYLNGDGVDRDFEKSFYWWKKLAETDYSVAQFNTGLYYAKGCGVDRDFAKAAEWMKKAADNGDEDADAAYQLYSGASENLKKAESGDAAAQAEIAKLFMQIGGSLDQFGTGKDYQDAFKWAKKSADQGDLDGMYCLALCYEHGRGTSMSPSKAAATYEKAAQRGHAPSQWNLAVCYLNGNGVAQDETKGYSWAYQAADQGNELAINGLEMQGKTIRQIIKRFSDPQYSVTLEGTQYLGRADRCEKLRPGIELKYKIAKDKNGDDAIECFFGGGSVGLISKWTVSDVIALLSLDRVALKITVRTCIPKSKRGARARNADVHLTLKLTEKKPETPEERAARLKAEEEARRKAEEKKKEEEKRKRAEAERIRKEREAEQQRKKEEARRKAEQQALEKARALEAIAREIQAENVAYNQKREALYSVINQAMKVIEALNEQKKALGFLKFKEKKEIDSQIAAVNGQMSNHKATLQQLDMSHNAVIDRLSRKKILTEPNIGDIISFGTDPNSQGSAALRWKVIEVAGDSVVLLSECVVALSSFYSAGKWLKDEFYQNAFNYEEQNAMKKMQGEFVRLPSSRQTANEPYTAAFSEHLRVSLIRECQNDGVRYGHTKAQIQNAINDQLGRVQQYWIDSKVDKNGFAQTSHGWIGAMAPFGVRAVIKVNVKKLR